MNINTLIEKLSRYDGDLEVKVEFSQTERCDVDLVGVMTTPILESGDDVENPDYIVLSLAI